MTLAKMDELTTSARNNFATCVALMVLTAIAVVSRIATRISLRQGIAAHDWFCFVSLVFFYAYCIVIINYIYNVSGYHAFDSDPLLGLSEVRNLLLTSFILEILLSLVITAVKISILWFYHSLFGRDVVAKRWIYGTGVACILWFLVAIFALIIFQCNPVDAYWNMFMSPLLCMDAKKLLLGYEITNLFIDVVILCIPVIVIGKLQLSKSKKIGASFVFLLGAFVCVSSIVRLTTIYDATNPDRPVLFSESIIWSTIQAGFAIICSCLPILGPLIGKATKNTLSSSKRYAYGSRNNRSGMGNVTGNSRRQFQGLNETDDNDPSWKVGTGNDTWNSTFNQSTDHVLQPLPAKGIVVDRRIDVV
ncbi:hypothetical protein GGS20DRAFT_28203 [Poronia punctata]|nr:hypothetical protein GGS20DRAFT_28203 [Poronia punctata]